MTTGIQTKIPVVYLQTHWDREWYQSFRSYQVRLAEVIDAILDRLETGVFPCFMLDGQTVLLDDYLEFRPNKFQQLKLLIESGKLRIGPWYVMPDEFLVSGESLLRNLKLGIQSSKYYGQENNFCGYLPDTFGHSADMPTILNQVNINNAIVWRGVSPKHSEFTWQSPSDEKLFAYYLADGYFQMMLHQSDDDPDLAEIGKAGALKKLADKLFHRSHLEKYLLPIGGDHLGPLDEAGIQQLKAILPNAIISTPDHFLKEIGKPENFKEIISGELTNNDEAFLLPGVYSSRVYLKRSNKKLEHALTRLWEPLQAIIATKTKQHFYQNELDIAWKTLILNHPHDSICGCSVDAVHQHNEVRFEEVNSLVHSVLPRLQHQLSKNIQGDIKNKNTKPEDCWLVFNTSDKPYTGLVYVEEDNHKSYLSQVDKAITVLSDAYKTDFMQVPLAHKTSKRHTGWIWVENTPPLGYQALSKKSVTKPLQNAFAKKVEKNIIENEFYFVEVNTDGRLNVTDKITNQQYPNLHVWKDTPQQGDSYNAAPIPNAPIETARLKKIDTWQKGPLVAGLILHYQIAKQSIQTRVWLEAGNPLLQFESKFTNKTSDHSLQVGFETNSPISEVTAESHFSIIKRHYDPHYKIQDHIPVAPWKELKSNTGPIQRFISANNQAWFTDGISEYEVSGNTLYLTYLRAFGMLSKADTGVRGAQAGPPLETPEGQCLNRSLSLRYAWCPVENKTSADLYRLANHFLGNIQTASLKASADQPFSLIQWDNPNIVYTACYTTEGNEIVLRLLNLCDKEQKLNFIENSDVTFTSYQEINALEQVQGNPQALATPLVFSAFELKTLKLLY